LPEAAYTQAGSDGQKAAPAIRLAVSFHTSRHHPGNRLCGRGLRNEPGTKTGPSAQDGPCCLTSPVRCRQRYRYSYGR
jgi:hypothetical protein